MSSFTAGSVTLRGGLVDLLDQCLGVGSRLDGCGEPAEPSLSIRDSLVDGHQVLLAAGFALFCLDERGDGGVSAPRREMPVLLGWMVDVFFGQNHVDPPECLDRQIQDRLDVFDSAFGSPVPYKGKPGAHSEIYALNDGLAARPGARLSDFRLYNVRLKGGKTGLPIERCAHCSFLTDGAVEIQ